MDIETDYLPVPGDRVRTPSGRTGEVTEVDQRTRLATVKMDKGHANLQFALSTLRPEF